MFRVWRTRLYALPLTNSSAMRTNRSPIGQLSRAQDEAWFFRWGGDQERRLSEAALRRGPEFDAIFVTRFNARSAEQIRELNSSTRVEVLLAQMHLPA